MTERTPLPPQMASSRIVVVLRTRDVTSLPPVVDTLIDGGVSCLEVTFTVPGALDVAQALQARYGDDVEVGLGTVLTTTQATEAVRAGAAYLVSPSTDPAIIKIGLAASVPVIPGALTPTEVWSGWSAGASAVKIFPASMVGPSHLEALQGPFHDVQLVPSGGITLEDVPAWLRAGASAVSIGSPLLGNAMRGGSLSKLAARVRDLTQLVAEAR